MSDEKKQKEEVTEETPAEVQVDDETALGASFEPDAEVVEPEISVDPEPDRP